MCVWGAFVLGLCSVCCLLRCMLRKCCAVPYADAPPTNQKCGSIRSGAYSGCWFFGRIGFYTTPQRFGVLHVPWQQLVHCITLFVQLLGAFESLKHGKFAVTTHRPILLPCFGQVSVGSLQPAAGFHGFVSKIKENAGHDPFLSMREVLLNPL